MAKKDKQLEDEANLFACLLLMPKKFIEEDMKKGYDLGDNKAMLALAKKYDVPLSALVFRITYYMKNKQ